MEHLFAYLLFAAKLLTVVGVIAVPLLIILAVRQTRRHSSGSAIEVERVNDSLLETALGLEAALLPEKAFKLRVKSVRKAAKLRADAAPDPTAGRTFVCEFDGDIRASAVAQLREEITSILSVATEHDTVVVVLESGGGTIHGYGLAASQLHRLRDRGIRLEIVIDRIAASGGYMMACVADEIIAAPFAIIGSIGVVAQLPNFHRLLQKHDIDFEQITAGKYKRTLTMFGENSDAARTKFQEEIDDAHTLFKEFVGKCRPQLDLDSVASGEYWFASRAIELGLVDRLSTSDDVIVAAAALGDVYRLKAPHKRSLWERLTTPLGVWLRDFQH